MPGFIFYEGPSRIDGAPIVGVATWESKNAKTGDLVQTWILRADVNPIQAINTGADSSICGDCPFRGKLVKPPENSKASLLYESTNVERNCYVTVGQAPLQIYHTYRAGNYPLLSDRAAIKFANKGLRYGAYGDPVAIPMRHWKPLARYCTGRSHPGYTHQWRERKFQPWRRFLMASTASAEENDLAHAKGWRTFRMIKDVSEMRHGEFLCPASEEAGFRLTCNTCGACNGRHSDLDQRHSVAICPHGGGGKRDRLISIL